MKYEHKNSFDYTKLDPRDTDGIPGQFRCPFAGHIRKMVPRKGTSLNLGDTDEDDIATLERSMIIRAGIPYGPEVSTLHVNYIIKLYAFMCGARYQTRNAVSQRQRRTEVLPL